MSERGGGSSRHTPRGGGQGDRQGRPASRDARTTGRPAGAGGQRAGQGGRDERRDGRRDGGRQGAGRDGSRDAVAGQSASRFADRGQRGKDLRESRVRALDNVPKRPEPALPDEVTGKELDREVRAQLRTLSKENAADVARHMVMVWELLEDDIEAAQAHAETVVRRASRVPAAREALGIVFYRQGEWSKALGEFRTARRLSGSDHLIPFMVDCERALGRLDKALDLALSARKDSLSAADQVELAVVVSGIRRDQAQYPLANSELGALVRRTKPSNSWAARLFYAYADSFLDLDDEASAREWFSRALSADADLLTDAAERLEELDGVAVFDAQDDEVDDDSDEAADEDISRQT